ncbi:MAG: PSD1 and planctomycete cytochrome C domain-containing protein [Pirellulales bacterium]|nr:PSD1 and planctomycete cytochrome C domain-containing protein [Pirellulales bacterium]
MMPRKLIGVVLLALHGAVVTGSIAAPGDVSGLSLEHRELFEEKIRPVLVEHCYKCHNSSAEAEAGLALDFRGGLREGGNSGPAILPGNSADSLLLAVLRHEIEGQRMPADGPRLDDEVLRNIARWIDLGAPDPRDQPPSAAELAEATSWEAIRQRRMEWWSFQPPKDVAAPDVDDNRWSVHPVDQFVLRRLREVALSPAKPVEPSALLRRLTFALTGLPPTPEQRLAFIEAHQRDPLRAVDDLVTQQLASPRFGERWARHWMDWVRYADTHGSEGDPRIPYAWRYRDYLIRALNADIPYPQLVREHLAGDLLDNPRRHPDTGTNESALGIGHFRFVQHGFAPTDALDELVRFTNDQIDTVSKAFSGLTVSCSRCHDHKFDAIGQSDFYALFGIFSSCRPGTITIDSPKVRDRNKTELTELKRQIRAGLARQWLATAHHWPAILMAAPIPRSDEDNEHDTKQATAMSDWHSAIDGALGAGLANPLHVWSKLRQVPPEEFSATWDGLLTAWRASAAALAKQHAFGPGHAWDLSGNDLDSWFPEGNGLNGHAAPPGSMTLHTDGQQVVADIYPAGVYTHLLSSKHNGVLNSPRMHVDFDQIWIRASGSNGATGRYVVQNYPRGATVFKIKALDGDRPHWYRFAIDYWHDDEIHFEFATAGDTPISGEIITRSWFGVTDVVTRNAGDPQPREEPAEFVAPLFTQDSPPPKNLGDLADRYGRALVTCVRAWQAGTISNEQTHFLRYFVRSGLLPNQLSELAFLVPLVMEYRRLEAEVTFPTRAPGIWEGDTRDAPLFVRGDHLSPGDPVPRRFLQSLGGQPYDTPASGRRELAEDLVQSDNPLTSRVIVNRIWHHVFGNGIVATPDNFGRLGQEPTHPELLDYLANRFAADGGSIKKMIRLLVTSQSFAMDSSVSAKARAIDPENRYLSHIPVRRLEAEAIRDSLLAISGQLDEKMYGPGVDGRQSRRSVYVQVLRNSLDPLLRAFDAPPPASPRGRRDVTNVPAQSLALMNDPQVIAWAQAWATLAVAETPGAQPADRYAWMLRTALGRDATGEDLRAVANYFQTISESRELQTTDWQDLAQAIFCLKEFIYLK